MDTYLYKRICSVQGETVVIPMHSHSVVTNDGMTDIGMNCAVDIHSTPIRSILRAAMSFAGVQAPAPGDASTALPAGGDAASLRAALSIIEDWDSEFNALFDLDGSSSSSSTSSPPSKDTRARGRPSSKKAGRPKNNGAETNAPYSTQRRDAKKLEILELRAQVDELQRIVDSEKAQYNGKIEPGVDTALAAAIREAWEKMAVSQKHERFAAQVENAKLRKVLDTQRKNAEKLAKLTQRVAALEQSQPTPPPAAPSVEDYEGPETDPKKLLQRLDALSLTSTEVLSSGGFLKHGRSCFREVQFQNENQAADGLEVNFEMTWLLPFSTEKVADAMWFQITQTVPRDRVVTFQPILQTDNDLVSRFVSHPTITTDNFGPSHGLLAARRHPPSTRDGSVLIVSHMESRAFDIERTKWKAHGRGDGWLLVERVEDQPVSVQGPISRIKWCRRVRIQPADVETMTSAQLSLWVHTAVTGPMRSRFERNLEYSLQDIENQLLAPRKHALATS